MRLLFLCCQLVAPKYITINNKMPIGKFNRFNWLRVSQLWIIVAHMTTIYKQLIAQGQKNRKLAVKHYQKGRTVMEIAALLGISRQAVDKTLVKAGVK